MTVMVKKRTTAMPAGWVRERERVHVCVCECVYAEPPALCAASPAAPAAPPLPPLTLHLVCDDGDEEAPVGGVCHGEQAHHHGDGKGLGAQVDAKQGANGGELGQHGCVGAWGRVGVVGGERGGW